MYRYLFSIFLILSMHVTLPASGDEQSIVYCISTPRSLSTSLLRAAQAQGCDVFNEPCAAITYPNLIGYMFKQDCLKDFDAVKKELYHAARTHPVFVKEIAKPAHTCILQDIEFVTDPRVKFALLTRKPHATAISMYKRLQQYGKEQVDASCGNAELLGFESMYRVYDFLKKQGKPVHMIDADQLCADPAATMKELCTAMHVPFDENALQWEDLGANFDGTIWHEQKVKDQLHMWHGDAIFSTGFKPLKAYEVDQNGQPTFSEIAPEHLDAVKSVYERNQYYYDLLKV